jgi:hypothetical protein
MHAPEIKRAALELIGAGHNDCEVSRRTGIARTTIRDWRRPSYKPPRSFAAETCPRCWRAARPIRCTPADYAELLAIYLGDGCISEHARTFRLRVHLDARYPAMNAEIEQLMKRCFPANVVSSARPSPSSWSGRDDTWAVLSVYSAHLVCLFPQHGPGRKHSRPIVLEPWQAKIVAGSPWPFIRGCIRTDGCAFVNRTDVHRPRPYEYLSYGFFNKSRDIVDLFATACERVSVFTRITGSPERGWSVRINKRESVALMQEHVGLKA